MRWGWSTYLLGEGCSAAKIQQMGLGESTSPTLSSFALGTWDQTESASVWLKKLPFLDLVRFKSELGCENLSLGKTDGAHAELQFLAQEPLPHLYPAFGLLMFSNSSAEMFRTHFGHCCVHLASISLQVTNHFVSGLKGMVKMFKTMNKQKKKKKRKNWKKEQRNAYLVMQKRFTYFMYLILFHWKMIKVLERSIYLCLTLNTIAVQCVKNKRNLNSQELNAFFFLAVM